MVKVDFLYLDFPLYDAKKSKQKSTLREDMCEFSVRMGLC